MKKKTSALMLHMGSANDLCTEALKEAHRLAPNADEAGLAAISRSLMMIGFSSLVGFTGQKREVALHDAGKIIDRFSTFRPMVDPDGAISIVGSHETISALEAGFKKKDL